MHSVYRNAHTAVKLFWLLLSIKTQGHTISYTCGVCKCNNYMLLVLASAATLSLLVLHDCSACKCSDVLWAATQLYQIDAFYSLQCSRLFLPQCNPSNETSLMLVNAVASFLTMQYDCDACRCSDTFFAAAHMSHQDASTACKCMDALLAAKQHNCGACKHSHVLFANAVQLWCFQIKACSVCRWYSSHFCKCTQGCLCCCSMTGGRSGRLAHPHSSSAWQLHGICTRLFCVHV